MPRTGSLLSSCRFINRHRSLPPPPPPTGVNPTPGVSGSEKVVTSQTEEGGNQKVQFWEASGGKGRRRLAEALTRVLAPSARGQISQIIPSRLRLLPDAAQGDCTFPGTPPLFRWLLISLM